MAFRWDGSLCVVLEIDKMYVNTGNIDGPGFCLWTKGPTDSKILDWLHGSRKKKTNKERNRMARLNISSELEMDSIDDSYSAVTSENGLGNFELIMFIICITLVFLIDSD